MAKELRVVIVGDARPLQKTLNGASVSVNRFGHDVTKASRGVAAGSGLFSSLGRSLAFASGGFIAAAGATDLLRGSIEKASEAAATQKQLVAQFRASGVSLEKYQAQIRETTLSVSRLAGFTEDELTQAFITAFRGSEKVSVALKIQAIAADVARGRHLSLAQATLALTKAYGGQSTALRRLGVLIPTTLHGMAALNFVQEKFAGQAKAGTTAQQKFSAAFVNFEQILGTALLPTFNKLLDGAAKWLDSTKNQKKVSEDATKAAHGFAKAFEFTAKVVKVNLIPFLSAVKIVDKVGNALDSAAKAAKDYLVAMNTATKVQLSPEQIRLFGVAGGAPPTGEDVALRGAAARQAPPGGTAAHPRASLDYQISLVQQQFAKAQLTAGLKDDRAILVTLAALTKRKIAQTKDLAARTQLYQSLGAIEQQIAQIDAKGEADRQAARQKQLAAQKKRIAAAQKAAAIEKANDAKLNQAIDTLRQTFASALDNVRNQIGQLFQGPVLAPSSGQVQAQLGFRNAAGRGLGVDTKDLRAQTAQYKRFNRDLARLRKLGAPKELITELRAQGTAGISQIEQILGGSKSARQQFFQAFRARERLAVRTARMDVTSDRVVLAGKDPIIVDLTVNLDGKVVTRTVTKHQQRHRKATASQTRGRDGGN